MAGAPRPDAEAAGVEVGAAPRGRTRRRIRVGCRHVGRPGRLHRAEQRFRLGQFRQPRRVVRRPLGRCRWRPARLGRARLGSAGMGHGRLGPTWDGVPRVGDDRAGAAPGSPAIPAGGAGTTAGGAGTAAGAGTTVGGARAWAWRLAGRRPSSGPGHRFRSTPGRMRACRNWAGPRDRRGALRPEAVPPARPNTGITAPTRPGIFPMFSNAGARGSR